MEGLAAGGLAAGSTAGGARHGRGRGAVPADRQGHRQPADRAVRRLRRLLDAGAQLVPRRPARKTARPPSARRGRQRAALDRDSRQLLDRACRAGHGAGHVRGLLRRRARPEPGVGHARRDALLRAARGFAGHRLDDPRPPDRLVDGVGLRNRRGAAALAAPGGRSAACRGCPHRSRAQPHARRCAAGGDERAGHRGVHRGEVRPARAVPLDTLHTARPGRVRPGVRQRRRAARMVHLAARGLAARASGPADRRGRGPRTARVRRGDPGQRLGTA